MDADWVGFVFCVAFHFDTTYCAEFGYPLLSLCLSRFYLSFENEYTEECFDMPLISLELNRVDSKNYIWIIYVSRPHCHFVKTGARIAFKTCQGFIMKQWGLRVITKEYIEGTIERSTTCLPLAVIDNVEESSSSNSNIEPKMQLPYNWFVSDEDEVEDDDAKGKEINLFNLGL